MPFCPVPLSYTLSFPYAQAEALAVQEREPTGKSRAEIAEIWGWFKRTAIFLTGRYCHMARSNKCHMTRVPYYVGSMVPAGIGATLPIGAMVNWHNRQMAL